MFSHPTLSKAVLLPNLLADEKNGELSSKVLLPVSNSSLYKEALYAWSALTHYARHSAEIFLGGISFYRTKFEQLGMSDIGNTYHGLGLAIDVGKMNGSFISPNNLTLLDDPSDENWIWLSQNLEPFGFGFEHNDQPWHIVYKAGDTRPRKVQYFISSVNWSKIIYSKAQFASLAFTSNKSIANSNHIKYLQSVLLLGNRFSSTGLSITGMFDSLTSESVKLLQSYYGLNDDGIVSESIWHAVNHEAIGMIGKTIWPRKKIEIYLSKVQKPTSITVPNVKPPTGLVDWTEVTNVTSTTFINTPEQMFYAYRKVFNHPNMWATRQDEVWGKRYGYTWIREARTGHPPFVYRDMITRACCGWSEKANLKLKNFINPSTGKSYGTGRTFMYPSLLNFLWMSMEYGFIWDGYGGSTGAKKAGTDGPHQRGVAIDFSKIGHVDYNGCFAWDDKYKDFRGYYWRSFPFKLRKDENGQPLNINVEKGRKEVDGYNLKETYIELLRRLKTFALSLPPGVRPWGFGSPVWQGDCEQLGLFPYIYEDSNPHHIHIDLSNGQRGVGGWSTAYNKYGILLPELTP